MKRLNLINTITGWAVFLVAGYVYLSTIESTASFWDCGEFIAAGYKFEVGHPPGAPVFMLLTRMASMLAGTDTSKVAVMVNGLSAIVSALTIMFLFWTITHLARKIFTKDNEELSTGKIIALLASGIIGAMAYTFSDTFWFSAVEGEVYATSSLFTAIVFWAILKWENISNTPNANRWIVLIAYLMGLSIGIHLLNLLAIPAIVLVYYFKKYPISLKGILESLAISALLLGSVMYIIIPGFVKVASVFELLFVNTFGLPFWSGVFFYLIALAAFLIWGVHYTHKNSKVILNTILISVAAILIGYSSYAIIIVRSLADPPMDQNNPENMFALMGYLNRDQYGDRPLFSGQYFNAQPKSTEKTKPIYTPIDGKYVITNHKIKYVYDKEYTTLFPRMWSSDPDHINVYLSWANIEEKDIYEARVDNQGNVVRDQEGNIVYDRTKPRKKPSFGQNLKFFFRYQLGHMYFRYFMWNFAGRQNDTQSHYKHEITKGNWITGIKFIDEARLGNQDKLPGSQLNSKARNRYYLLPLLLGLIGMVYQYKKRHDDFWTTLALFVMTGIAIVVYLNQNPIQPRERDYAYAGSFYAFAIWIGLGVLALYELMNKYLPEHVSAYIAGVLCFAGVPYIMAKENWDDHNRSGRYMARDFAYNYLNSCAKNAILFTNGDNDTFPLWYAQEVEGIRTDVRVINLSYLGADWYIEQMHRKAYKSDPVPFTLTKDKYISGKRDIVYLIERLKGYTDLKQAIDFLADDSDKTKRIPNYNERIDYLPNRRFSIPVDKEKVLANGTVSPKFADQIVPEIQWELGRNYVLKNHMMVLDLLGTNNWERPVYFAITVSGDNYLNLDNYFQVHGLAYRIVPVRSESGYPNTGGIDTDIVYDNLLNKFKWGGIDNPDVYIDENVMRMLSNFRSNFSRLAETLINEGKPDSAKTVLDKSLEIMPDTIVRYDIFTLAVIESYLRLNEKEKALQIAEKLKQNTYEELDYLVSLDKRRAEALSYEKRLNLHIINELARLMREFGDDEKRKELETRFQDYLMALNVGLY
ncbi:MAG: DUF2723 domain-containing protein [Bacteroidales bacterium]|nr:DUF2723 domain-containing protein [Bacteroidales bacterium]